MENGMEASLRKELPYDPAILLLCLLLHYSQAKLWKQPRCLTLMNELRKCGIYILWNFIQP
jgi:hypothetical protein